MIFKQTKLDVLDNSGALIVSCIQPLRASKLGACLGGLIVCSIKKNLIKRKKKPVLRGQIFKALILSTKVATKRFGHVYISADKNTVILVVESSPVGNRIFGSVLFEFRLRNLSKVVAIAETFI